MHKIKCHISKKPLKINEAHQGYDIRKEILALIQKDYPEFDEQCYISMEEFNRYRKKYLSRLIAAEAEELDALEREVIDSIASHKILSENIEEEIEKDLSFGQKISDVIANFGGSWIFISIFFIFVFSWMIINVWILSTRSFDPYPFILLNLVLSCIAAIQAPVIMMSQNRLEEKDRKRGEHDFKINLKAELEIQILNEKIDHLIAQQSKKLMEIQSIQADYLEDILKILENKKA